jgi:putative Mg2+ transporter-C (MgtC) family protein
MPRCVYELVDAASRALPSGQGWEQVGDLTLAAALGCVIGLERELRHKDAGLRTQTVVALGAALFVLISKYGFTDVLAPNRSTVDPSRVASLVVSGIGFIGAGLIFVHRDTVRGLTTAAAVWLTAAVGAAAGAGLWLLALAATALHLVSVRGLTPAARRIRRRAMPPSDDADDD